MQPETPKLKKHGTKNTTSLGMATSLTLKWRKWSYAERRMKYLQALDMNAEGAEARSPVGIGRGAGSPAGVCQQITEGV
jgi:hypothetical protein